MRCGLCREKDRWHERALRRTWPSCQSGRGKEGRESLREDGQLCVYSSISRNT